MNTSKILRPPAQTEPQDPRARAFVEYMKALDAQCKRILEEEAANGDPVARQMLDDIEATA